MWNDDKKREYWNLKRKGYDKDHLFEHFGDDIYDSGLYTRKSNIMPCLQFLTEITITPEYTEYNLSKIKSVFYIGKNDYIIDFEHKDVKYIICLFLYIIDDLETYNFLLITEQQWTNYKNKLKEFAHKGYITDHERNELIQIVEKETGYDQLFPIMKKTSYVLLDVLKLNLNDCIISIGETTNLAKINLYRNIIKNSFPNMIDLGIKIENDTKYYLYKSE